MFSQPQNFSIVGGTFTQIVKPQFTKGFDYLKEAVAPAAFHNSGERFDPPKWHPNTRIAVIKKIMAWIRGQDPETKDSLIMWLRGGVGAGKSAIAQTIAELCHTDGRLLASFFFSEVDPKRNNAQYFVATIAYQIWSNIPAVREPIAWAIEGDPLILTRSLVTQFLTLVVRPLQDFFQSGQLSGSDSPRIILINGLDKCLDGQARHTLLDVILKSILQHHVPLIFFIASRAEPDISAMFHGSEMRELTTEISLDDLYLPNKDIEFPWPTDDFLEDPARARPYALNGEKSSIKSFLVTKTCWVASEHALRHAQRQKSLVSESFNRWNIQESSYAVLAGFDESLIESGIGYLEQIHVFVSAEVGATSPLLSELGRIFSPFSSMLFTESESYRMPVFKEDGIIWEFDAFVYYSTSKFADGGSSAKTPLTVINFPVSEGQAGDQTGFSQDSSSSGGGENNERGYTEKGKKRQRRDQDEPGENDKGDKDPDDDPEEPMGDKGGTIAAPKRIFFAVVSQLYPMSNQNPFQSLKVQGDLTIQTMPHAQSPRRFSKRHIHFTELKFGTQPRAGSDVVYKQSHVRLIVDSQQEIARVKVIKPRRTPAFDGHEKESSSTKTTQTRGLTFGFTAGANPQGMASLTSANTNEDATNNEKKRYTSRITQQDEYGVVHWGFAVDDANDQKGGLDMRDNVLPSAQFEFVGPSSSSPPAPPARMNIEIASYWSIIGSLRSAPKRNGSPWFLNYTGSFGDVLVESYSNLCQIVALETIPADLPGQSNFEATVHVSPTPGVGYLSDYTEVMLETDNSMKASPGVFPDDLKTLTTLTLPMHKNLELSATFGQTLQRLGSESKSH